MGLDISYYSKLVAAVGNEGFDEDGEVALGSRKGYPKILRRVENEP